MVITLSDCQRRKLVNSLKNNKSVFLRLKANQVNSSKIKKNPFLTKTKTGYSLKIDEKDIPEFKNGGFLQALLPVLMPLVGQLAYDLLKKPASDLGEYIYEKGKNLVTGKCVDQVHYTKCNKCHGKGMMISQ